MKEKRWIVDTTLRDGEQCPGIAFTEKEKIELAIMLDRIGVYEIEAGIPEMKVESLHYISEIKKECKNAKISLWSRMNPSDVKNAILYKPDILHIGVPVSYIQIYSKLKKNKTWVIKNMEECVRIAVDAGIDVIVGFEDASRSDEGFILSMAILAKRLGAVAVRVADTVGVLTPIRAGSLVRKVVSETGIPVEFHAHNDFGMAIANSLESAKAGAAFIDCTLFGVGERSGNCDLFQFLHASERLFDFNIEKRHVRELEEKFLTMQGQETVEGTLCTELKALRQDMGRLLMSHI